MLSSFKFWMKLKITRKRRCKPLGGAQLLDPLERPQHSDFDWLKHCFSSYAISERFHYDIGKSHGLRHRPRATSKPSGDVNETSNYAARFGQFPTRKRTY